MVGVTVRLGPMLVAESGPNWYYCQPKTGKIDAGEFQTQRHKQGTATKAVPLLILLY